MSWREKVQHGLCSRFDVVDLHRKATMHLPSLSYGDGATYLHIQPGTVSLPHSPMVADRVRVQCDDQHRVLGVELLHGYWKAPNLAAIMAVGTIPHDRLERTAALLAELRA